MLESSQMKHIIGLGNPGKKYQNNRHNAGYMLIDFLKNKDLPNFKFHKTDTMMNNSGKYVASLVNYHKIELEDLYIVHDDLDLPLGEYKIQKGIGPKVHNGVLSVEKHLSSKDFYRIRIGVDAREPNNRISGESYVLMDFSQEEMKILDDVFEQIFQVLKNG